jgi:hypothetical protein
MPSLMGASCANSLAWMTSETLVVVVILGVVMALLVLTAIIVMVTVDTVIHNNFH